jgi:hypothetical protein
VTIVDEVGEQRLKEREFETAVWFSCAGKFRPVCCVFICQRQKQSKGRQQQQITRTITTTTAAAAAAMTTVT